MITLTLLHPIQSTPVQSWTFEHEPTIRIGRSSDNHVILYSAVVSRHHVELRQNGSKWEIVSLGANGTYLNGKQITQVTVVDGVVIRLARSGPNIQISLGVADSANDGKTQTQQIKTKPLTTAFPEVLPKTPLADLPNPPPALPPTRLDQAIPNREAQEDTIGEKRKANLPAPLFDIHTGKPLQVLHSLRDYQVVKILNQGGVGQDQVVWRQGQSWLARSLNPKWQDNSAAREQFHQQAQRLLPLRHPGLPQFVDFFEEEQPYLVQEWVHGQSLGQRVEAQGSFSQERAIEIILQLCEALEYLHQQSSPVLHQNLNPDTLVQRVVVEELPAMDNSPEQPSPALNFGRLAVTGFLSLNTLATEVQPVAASFSAPEQQQGEVFAASDLFALGTLLVYLLTGKQPRLFYAQREQGFRFYPEYVPGITPELVAIVRKLTHPRPEERYASAQQVAAALQQV